MLTKHDLTQLGISPGPIFAEIFSAVKNCKDKESALQIAISIKDGTFQKTTKKMNVVDPDSVFAWLLDFKFCPSATGDWPASNSEKRRMLDQGAVTIDSRKSKADDVMPLEPFEIVFFKGSPRQTTIW
jgi:hypothetical protein